LKSEEESMSLGMGETDSLFKCEETREKNMEKAHETDQTFRQYNN